MALLVLLGFLAGYLSLTAALTGAPLEVVNTTEGKFWTYVAGLQVAYWAVIAPISWRWLWDTLREYSAVRLYLRDALVSASGVLVVLVVPLSLVGVTWPAALYPPARIWLHVAVALVVALPAALGIKAIQAAAQEGQPIVEANPGEQYLILRSRLRAFLFALGPMVTSTVIAVGAFRNALNVVQPGAMSTQGVLLYSALFTIGLGFLYVPAHYTLQRRGWYLVDGVCQLPPLNDPSFYATLERRETLASFLKLRGSARETLEEAAMLLAPLVSGIVSTSLGK